MGFGAQRSDAGIIIASCIGSHHDEENVKSVEHMHSHAVNTFWERVKNGTRIHK